MPQVSKLEQSFFHFQPALSKKQILTLFQSEVFPTVALQQMQDYKSRLDDSAYLKKSGAYIYNRIKSTFCQSIHIRGLENVPKDQPCIMAYPHKASILDGTLVNVLLLSLGYKSKAIARVSPDKDKQSSRDRLFAALSDFVLPVKQRKDSHGCYQQSANRDTVAFFKQLTKLLKNRGVALIAPEGQTNQFMMGDVQNGFMLLAQKQQSAIVPCTIEYHESLTPLSFEERKGNYYKKIDITFHPAVHSSQSKKIENVQEKVNEIMTSLASGYKCRFKGGNFLTGQTNQKSLRCPTVTRFEEKFTPLYHYVQSLHLPFSQKNELLIELLEKEFLSSYKDIRDHLTLLCNENNHPPTPIDSLMKILDESKATHANSQT